MAGVRKASCCNSRTVLVLLGHKRDGKSLLSAVKRIKNAATFCP